MRPAAPSQNAGYSQWEGRKETEACDVKPSRGDSGEKLCCAEDFQPSQQQSCDPSSHPTSGRASNLWRVRLRRMENFRHFCCWRREPVYCPEGKGSARQRWDFLAPCDLSRGFWQPTPGRCPTSPAPLLAGARCCPQARPSCGVQPGFRVASPDTVPVPGGTITLVVGASP